MQKLPMLITVVLLGGCVTQYQGNEASPYFVVPAGSTLTLNRELTFAPEEVGTYFQRGQVVAKMQIDLYRPHCKLELHKRLDRMQTVKPDSFRVMHSSQEILHSVQLPVVLAANAAHRTVLGGRLVSDSPSPELYATRLVLRSEGQPHVSSLTCGHLESPPVDARHLSIQQIRQALGEIISLQLAGTAPH
jgi:hypothetical protein